MTKSWGFTLGESAQKDVRRLVKRLADEVCLRRSLSLGPDFAYGHAGIALFLFEAAQFSNERRYLEECNFHLQQAFTIIQTTGVDTRTFAGWPGLVWVADLIGAPIDKKIGAYVNEALAMQLPNLEDIDLVDGLSGFGFFLLSASTPKTSARRLLKNLLMRISDLKTVTNGQISWKSRRGPADLGYAHGIGGLLGFLSFAHRQKVSQKICAGLMGPIAELLLEQATTFDSMPHFLAGGTGGRKAWCYGDIGIAFALTIAGRELKNRSLIEAGRNLILRNKNKTPAEMILADSSLCHGISGVALVAHRLYRETRDDEVLQLCQRWTKKALQSLKQEMPLPAWKNLSETNGLLSSPLGTALVLMACVDGRSPSWDSFFGLSAPNKI